MKPLIAALIFGLFFLSPCFAQTQTGNASYNASKNGLTLAHSSLSFGTRVRITNLRNNREVIAVVDGRIPVSDPRIADISAEAGGAIGMPASGYTQVRLEILLPPPPETASVAVSPVAAPAVVVPPSIPAAEPPAPVPAPIPPAEPPAPAPAAPIPAVVAPVPVPVEVPRSQEAAAAVPQQSSAPVVVAPPPATAPVPAVVAPVPVEVPRSQEAAAAVPQRSSAPAVPASSSSDQEARLVESIQVITPQSQYATPAAIVQSCFSSPLCYVILILLIIAVLLLTAILVLLLRMRPLPWRLWFYPLWVRRRLRYLKKRRF